MIVYAFVIMPNHFHLIWQVHHGHKREEVQRDFLKYTAQKIKYDLIEKHPEVLKRFAVKAKDRKYQFWERNPLSLICIITKLLCRSWSIFITTWYRNGGN